MQRNLFLILVFFNISLLFSEFKNVKILDLESGREMKKYMKMISKDLGVKCSFCHDLNDKSIDTKNKNIAREMIEMQNNLNKQFFSNRHDSTNQNNNGTQISCWTCHRGSKIPELLRSEK